MKHLLAVTAIGMLSACATTVTGPTPAGPDTYVISAQSGAFPTGREDLAANALAKANEKCTSESKILKLVSAAENLMKATVVFSCHAK